MFSLTQVYISNVVGGKGYEVYGLSNTDCRGGEGKLISGTTNPQLVGMAQDGESCASPIDNGNHSLCLYT